MRSIDEIKQLGSHVAHGTAPAPTAEYSFTPVETEDAFRAELNELAKDFNSYRRNKLDIFEILQESWEEALPNRVLAAVGAFAEIRNFANNQKVGFKVKKGRNRGKRFVSKAGLSGRYEAFRLDSETFTMETSAVGGATLIDFERYLSGEEDLAENVSVLMEGFEDYIYRKIQEALVAAIDNSLVPTANKVTSSGFDADKMQGLISVAKRYGTGAVIFATSEFIGEMGADVIVNPVTSGTPVVSGADIDDIHNTGYIKMFRGCPVIELPQSFIDDTNTTTAINPQFAYVFPTGGEKVVKVGLEGDLIVDDQKNADQSMEIQAYKKIGVAIVSYNNWCIFRNTAITDTHEA